MHHQDAGPVAVSRTIAATADVLFDLLANPSNHPRLDGSGMLVAATGAQVVTAVGDVFTMKMHNGEMGDYVMDNHVVEYEAGRRLSWEPVLAEASREEDRAEIGDRSAPHRWGFVLEPRGGSATEVTELYDCSTAPEWLRRAVRGGERWRPTMERTLEKLERLAAGETTPRADPPARSLARTGSAGATGRSLRGRTREPESPPERRLLT